MKVLFFSNEFPAPNNPLKAVFNLRMCQALSSRHDVRVVAPVAWVDRWKPRSTRAPETPAFEGVTYGTYYFPPRVLHASRGTFMWWSLRSELLSMARNWRPDVVLAYWAHPDGETALRFARHVGAPLVQMVGGSDVLLTKRSGRQWDKVRHVLTSASAVVTIGKHLGKEVVLLGVPPERVVSLYRPIDPTRFSPGSMQLARRQLGLPLEGGVVLWVGRFVGVKSVHILLEAADLVRRERPNTLVCLVGRGPEEPMLRALVAAHGLEETVRFVGEVAHQDLATWYRAANVTALPSLSEGVPNVLLESMACGTPFVASHVGGIPEIADPRLDRLVTPGSPESLAAALVELLARPVVPAARAVLPATPDVFTRQLESVLARAVAQVSTMRVAS